MKPLPQLDRQLVDKLEQELERAIAEVIEQRRQELPIGPDRPTMHFMAKAAVAVYEAAARNTQSP